MLWQTPADVVVPPLQFSRVDYAVNCAGITNAPTATAQLSTEVYDRVVNINQRGIFFCVREQLKVMEKQDVLER